MVKRKVEMRLHFSVGVVVGLVVTGLGVTACGRRGDPLPPRRIVPAATQDLVLMQQGRLLIVQIGYPQTTTSGEVLPGLERVEVYILEVPGADRERPPQVEAMAFERGASLLYTASGVELESAAVGDRLVLQVPLNRTPDAEAGTEVYAVRTVSTSSEASAFSNLAVLYGERPPSAPHHLTATERGDGVRLEWQAGGGGIGFHLYRRQVQQRRYGPPIERSDVDARAWIDGSATFGGRYFYTVRTIASVDPLIESDPSNEIEVEYLDSFPPEPPASVIVLTELERVRLVIEASPSSDVVGYHIYRRDGAREDDLEFRRLTDEPITDRDYQDSGLVSGQSYIYRVTAVDSAGNEGSPGDEVTASLP